MYLLGCQLLNSVWSENWIHELVVRFRSGFNIHLDIHGYSTFIVPHLLKGKNLML